MAYLSEGKSDKYKYVYKLKCVNSANATQLWQGQVSKQKKLFKTEREAAKWVDLQLIAKGREPVNILVLK